MVVFYSDENIRLKEVELDFKSVIEIVEEKFNDTNHPVYLATLIGYSWFFYIEGDINNQSVEYKWEYYLEKWKHYISLGIKNFGTEANICWIIGYSIYLHWIHLGPKYQNVGIEMLKLSHKLSQNDMLKSITSCIIKNIPVSNLGIHVNDLELFPTNSILDNYFKEMFAVKKNKDC